jgi:hypothetical protein
MLVPMRFLGFLPDPFDPQDSLPPIQVENVRYGSAEPLHGMEGHARQEEIPIGIPGLGLPHGLAFGVPGRVSQPHQDAARPPPTLNPHEFPVKDADKARVRNDISAHVKMDDLLFIIEIEHVEETHIQWFSLTDTRILHVGILNLPN